MVTLRLEKEIDEGLGLGQPQSVSLVEGLNQDVGGPSARSPHGVPAVELGGR